MKIKFKITILVVLVLLCVIYIFVPKKRTYCTATIPESCHKMKCVGIPVATFGGGVCFGNDLGVSGDGMFKVVE